MCTRQRRHQEQKQQYKFKPSQAFRVFYMDMCVCTCVGEKIKPSLASIRHK